MKTIKKGQEFECIKDYVMLDGNIAYKTGKKYLCELEGRLTDEQGIKEHNMTLCDEFYEHFKLIESMKNTIETPAGCKIAKTEIIDRNLIVTYERDLPDSVKDIIGRPHWIHANGSIELDDKEQDLFQFSTKERAEAILALGQLLELAAYVGGIELTLNFEFDNQDLLSDFNKKHTDLFEKAKNLL